jgi:hypothetical protein
MDFSMQQLVESGWITDIILVLIALEIIALAILGRTSIPAPRLQNVIGTLFSGLFLVAALRSALVGANWWIIAACLFAALLSHLFDLRSRWPRS